MKKLWVHKCDWDDRISGDYLTELEGHQLFSKTHLVPHGMTIPRLELLGVLIGVGALKFLCKELCWMRMILLRPH